MAAILLLVHGKTRHATACPTTPSTSPPLTRPPAVALMGISSAQQNTVQNANSTQPAAAAAAPAAVADAMASVSAAACWRDLLDHFHDSRHVRHVSATRCCVCRLLAQVPRLLPPPLTTSPSPLAPHSPYISRRVMTTESMPATPRTSSSGYSRVAPIQLNRPVGSLRGLWRTSGSYLCVGGDRGGLGGRG